MLIPFLVILGILYKVGRVLEIWEKMKIPLIIIGVIALLLLCGWLAVNIYSFYYFFSEGFFKPILESLFG